MCNVASHGLASADRDETPDGHRDDDEPGEQDRQDPRLDALGPGLDGRLVIEPGRHILMVGTSAVDLPLRAEVDVRGERRVLPARSRFFSGVEIS